MNISDISIGIPSYNTIDYLKMAYNSLRRYYPTNEILIYDDGSDDGSWAWLQSVKANDQYLVIWRNETGTIHGHTKTYNWMARDCTKPLFTIFHSDMIASPMYLENLVKQWAPGTVVSATRIEPEGIYPPGPEKILKPFGIYHDQFKAQEFLSFCAQARVDFKDKTTRGIFAPWLISKEDFLAIGGHDEKSFAPFPHEDQDIFVRFVLAGYELIQSWDALCWHWISRGHRSWAKNGVGKDAPDFKFYEERAARNYLRKWNRWMRNDSNRHPILHPVYDLVFHLDVDSVAFLKFIEPWAQKVYVTKESIPLVDEYLIQEQPNVNIDLSSRFGVIDDPSATNHDIVVSFTEENFSKDMIVNSGVIKNLGDILDDPDVDVGNMELGIFKLTCKKKQDISKSFIKVENI